MMLIINNAETLLPINQPTISRYIRIVFRVPFLSETEFALHHYLNRRVIR